MVCSRRGLFFNQKNTDKPYNDKCRDAMINASLGGMDGGTYEARKNGYYM